jgi:hypothetical protein
MSLLTEDEARTKLYPFAHGYCLLVHPPVTERLPDMIRQNSGRD